MTSLILSPQKNTTGPPRCASRADRYGVGIALRRGREQGRK